MAVGRFGLVLAGGILIAAWTLAPPRWTAAQGADGASPQSATSTRLIIPGHSVGPARLGATAEQLRKAALLAQPLQLRADFTERAWRQGFEKIRECGREIDETSWGTPPWSSAGGYLQAGGGVHAYLSSGRVLLIVAASPVYRTAGGLSAGSTPEQVQRLWPNLRAYSDAETSMALYNRPVIYWVSQAKGIAFAFASNGPGMGWTRSLYSIEVFRPSWKFQPHGCAWPGEWSPLPPGTIHLRHAKPNTRIALRTRERGLPGPTKLSAAASRCAITRDQRR